ncbi:adenylate/guanylate cyclase domain-containing protein [Skermanella rosea]|uniref:Adenylate/guanylate cyclase domain-containing protein n=1 Tax=Skermanella cutis TaxID=2775420 RepID=A0ABX7B5A5_9PROT|nr:MULTISPECIES: adenylate/guanylate cyclase domain-containing protein [Skermanella]QQP89529.1 adenylate/guanylate cyclase domain-containing protein [Skermanella sp. TT6]UEM03675.1 adenylate/guanylate cyclase domain-containing protein [Skermanella rosea]
MALRYFVCLVIGGLLLAALYGALTDPSPLEGAVNALVVAAVIGLPLAVYETHLRWLVPSATRRWPFGWLVLIKSAGYTVWILLGTKIGARLTHHSDGPALVDLFVHRETVVVAMLAAIVVNILFAVNKLLGPGMLFNFLIGRYHRPRREERLFLFLDICHSTTIAEQIGDLKFHAYLDDFFRMVGRATRDCGGEVHDYIGDEVIVTWFLDGSAVTALDFFPVLAQRLAARQVEFRRTYGYEVAFRAGLHLGPVVAGEVGEVKRKIAFLGDTVNTAARLEQLARTREVSLLASRSVLDRLQLPPGMKASSLGLLHVRGKAQPMEVFRLDLLEEPISVAMPSESEPSL